MVREYEKRRRPVTCVTSRLRAAIRSRYALRAPRRSRRRRTRGQYHRKPAAVTATLLTCGNEEVRAVLAPGGGADRRWSRRSCGWLHRVLHRVTCAGRRRRWIDARGLQHGLRLLGGGDGWPHRFRRGAHWTERCGRCPSGRLCRLRRELGRRARPWRDSFRPRRSGRRREQCWCHVLRRTRRRRCLRVRRLRGARDGEKRDDHRARGGRHGITVTLGGV